ncbi:hypothetical protein H0H92_013299 [Tricholoma furcatifolium]|nr:hypothetical protein H0H92_013299 [Tricholoma furcatifolium]
MRLNQLPLSLLVSSFILVASNAVPVHSTLLTPDTFHDITATGTWFIEFFSPYCGHCRAFAPTWEQLVQESEKDHPSVNLAQVDCSLYGDLCSENSVKGYPTLRMFNEGKDLGEFKSSRDLPKLHAFIESHVSTIPAPLPPTPQININPSGEVLSLTASKFASSLAKGPMFVKFYAPWCGHCKKLAPIWKQLASSMQGKLTIAEVNCEENSSLCKAHNIQGYPTLIYLSSGGLRSEYQGGRKLEQLKSFAEKASNAGLHPMKTEDLQGFVAENEVMYLLVHSDDSILDTVARASTPLLGSPPIYTSSSASLFSTYHIPQTSTWALLVFKDHIHATPTSILHERAVPVSSSGDAIREWLLKQRLPTTLELSQDTFQSVMNAPQAPLVVIAAVTPSMQDRVVQRIREVGKKWRAYTKGSGVVNGREVVWTWMDAERWKDWMKSMYGIVVQDGEENLEEVRVVVTDHQSLVYYDHDPADQRLKITSSKALFETVEAAATGTLPYKNSENLVERIARYFNTKLVSVEKFVVLHPWSTIFFLFMIFGAIFMGLKRLLADDAHSEYRKVERLD